MTSSMSRVCVGVDGSPEAWHALDWAAGYAADTGSQLTVVHVEPGDGDDCGYGSEVLADALARLAEEHPSVQVHSCLATGDVIRNLVDIAADAALLVVGRHPGARLAADRLAAMGHRLLAEARCPVAVVDPDGADTRARNVVVTVASCSASGRAATRFAAAEAARRGAVLHGVRCTGGELAGHEGPAEELARWLADTREHRPDLVVRGSLEQAPVVAGLHRAAAGACLLVIGRDGRPGRVGHVVARVAAHPSAPTVVVPENWTAAPHRAPAGTRAPVTHTNEGLALAADGGIVAVRHLVGTDRPAVLMLADAASDRSVHFRFFSSSRDVARRYCEQLCAQPQSPTRETFVAEIDGAVAGLATLEALRPGIGELAVLVADAWQHHGLGTLLVEALVTAARRRDMRTLVADVLTDNSVMAGVIGNLGLASQRTYAEGVMHIRLDLDAGARFADAVTAREAHAEAASLAPLLAPGSVAVIGVGSRRNSVGRALLRNLITSGFTGELHVVHPRHRSVLGVPAVATVDELPAPVDLAVIAVPAAAVPGVVADCAARGVRAAVVLSSGLGETGARGRDAERAMVADARRHGMRLVGPNCLGVLNTAQQVRLNATFGRLALLPGGLALASQSGAVGIAVVRAGADRGAGTAQFVSMGNKADVSGNDLMLVWAADAAVTVVALYLESLGNPRKFVRIARMLTRSKPVLALKSGRGRSGQRAGRSHTAAAAAADPVVDALFAQAGVQRLDTIEELVDAARVLDAQPLPAGRRVAVVGNSGGPEILAADVAEAAGLDVVAFSEALQEQLRAVAPGAAGTTNPVDLGAGAQPAEVRAALAAVVASQEVDSILTVFVETLATRPADIRAVVADIAGHAPLPVVATEVGAPPYTAAADGTGRALPVFGFPEPAVRALACATRAAAVQRRPAPAPAPRPAGWSRVHGAVRAAADQGPRWLDPLEGARLLRLCGVRVVDQLVADGAAAALDAARELGYPVAVKVLDRLHKTDTGGVVLDVRDGDELRAALARLGDGPVLLQPMLSGGTELIVGAVQDPQFGPVVLCGPGGVLTDLVGAHSLRLAPVDRHDVAEMLDTPTMQRLLKGFRGAPAIDAAALTELVRRVSWLVDDCPEIAELDLNPLVCRGSDLVAVDVKVRVAPAVYAPDPQSRLMSGSAPLVPARDLGAPVGTATSGTG